MIYIAVIMIVLLCMLTIAAARHAQAGIGEQHETQKDTNDASARSEAPEHDPPQPAKTTKLPPGYELSCVGNLDDKCPYCSATMAKRPSRKTACRACGEHVFVRTRPLDRQRVLVTRSQAEQIELEWLVVQGFSPIPAHNQHRCDELSREAALAFARNDWGLYRNAKVELARIREREQAHEEALDLVLEACFLDSNGPNNCGTRDADVLRFHPPFTRKTAMLAPGVVMMVEDIATEIGLSRPELRKRYLDIAQSCIDRLPARLALTPLGAWRELAGELQRP